MCKLIVFLVILCTICGCCIYFVFKNIGKSPSDKDLTSFTKLPYFKDGKFVNIYTHVPYIKTQKDFSFLKLLLGSPNKPIRKIKQYDLIKKDFLTKPKDKIFYWLGHSSSILELKNKRIGIDLVLNNASPIPFTVRRFQKAPIKRKDLPYFDYIVITHNHYDHLEYKTIKYLKNTNFIVPLGLKATLLAWGVPESNIHELGWHDSFEDGSIKIIATPAIHFSGRGFGDSDLTLWNSYVIQSNDYKIFWTGDGGYGTHHKEIGQKYGPFDLLAVEIDAWNPRWASIHMFPEQVKNLAEDLKTKKILPVH